MFSTIRKSLMSVALAVVVAVGALGQAHAVPALSNFLGNKLIDFTLRGQTYVPPTTVFVALATTTGSPAACGTEVTGGSYARVSVATSLTNFSGTQGAGTTAVSSGTNSGTGLAFSNNIAVTFPAPTASWGTVTEFCVFDALTGGNLLFRSALSTPQTISSGATAPSFAIAALSGNVN